MSRATLSRTRVAVRRQHGATTLLLVLGLVLLATLASAWSSRAVLIDLLTSQTRGQALQARSAAQAALATGQADVLDAFGQSVPQDPFADQALRAACPEELQGPRWQCARLAMKTGASMDDWQFQVMAARDLLSAPHVWQLRARSLSNTGQGQAWVRESLFAPVIAPAPADMPAAALLLNGCFSALAGSRWQICPSQSGGPICMGSTASAAVFSHFVPDVDGNGAVSAAERNACLAVGPHQLPGGGSVASTPEVVSRNPCNRATWRSVFGDNTPAQLKAWSDAQASSGLHVLSQPARSIYWVDSPADWTQSLGSPQAPVVLVFSHQACAVRCPRIAAGVQIHGTVFVDADCRDDRLQNWQAGTIDGLLAIEGGIQEASGNSLIRARAYARQAFNLHWPEGMDTRRIQRVAGSRREGPP